MNSPFTTASPRSYFPRSSFGSDAPHARCDTLIRRPSGSLIMRNRNSVPPNHDVLTLSSATTLFVRDAMYDTTNLRPSFDDTSWGKKTTPRTNIAPQAISTFGQRRFRLGKSVRATGLGKFISWSMEDSV